MATKVRLVATSHTKGAEGQEGDILEVDDKTLAFFTEHGVAVPYAGDGEPKPAAGKAAKGKSGSSKPPADKPEGAGE